MNWPGKSLNLKEKLSEAIESQRKAFLEELDTEQTEEQKTQKNAKESTGEVKATEYTEGLEPLTWTQHLPDGTIKHYIKHW